MAKLRQQAVMTKHLHNFFKETGYSGGNSTYSYRIGHLNTGVPEGDFILSIQTRMTLRDRFNNAFRKEYFKSHGYQLDRTHKIDALYQSCRADGFIEDVEREQDISALIGSPNGTNIVKTKTGIRVSKKGSDLVHPMGYVEELLNKYPTQKLIVTTIVGTILGTGVLGVILLRIL